MPSDHASNAVGALRRRLCIASVLARFLVFVRAWWFAWGLFAIVGRLTAGVGPGSLLPGFAAFPLLALLAWLDRRSRFPSRGEAAALLDAEYRLGGALMAREEGLATELPDPGQPCVPPAVRVGTRREYLLHAAGIAFLVLASFLPLPPSGSLTAAGALEIGDKVADLKQTVEILEEERILEDAEALELTRTLDDLEKEAAGDDPGKTWEALDRIAEKLERRTAEEAEEAGAEALAADTAARAAEALREAAERGLLDAGDMAEIMGELERLMREREPGDEVADMLAEAAADGRVTPEELTRLAEKAGMRKAELLRTMARLCEGGLVDPEKLRECMAALGREGEGADGDPAADLAAFLAGEDAGLEGATEVIVAMLAGRGGIDRGPGHVQMTWTDGSSEEGAGFLEESLPADLAANLRDARQIGISKAVPKTNEAPERVSAGALGQADAGGGSAATAVVLPKHRRAVRTFFARDE